ncbi:MAG: TIGR02281 family clan AA aspartic protease [Micropepsaceae bacterium]
MNRVIVLVVVLIAITGLILWVSSGSGFWSGTYEGSARLTATIAMLVLMTSSLVLGWRGSASQALRYAFIWIAVGFGLILAFSFRDDVGAIWQRVAGEVNPAKPVQRTSAEVVLRQADDGHFYVDTDVNGTSIRMLADTGASMVVLSEADAERAGLDPDGLDYTMVVSTANGQAMAAPVTLDEVRVGSIVRNDVRAAVTRGLSGSLLGMSFFTTLSKFAIESDELVLKD